MYESTVNIDILRDSGVEPFDFLDTTLLQETTTITGTVSGVVNITSMWINNTISDKVVSVIETKAETQELIEIWADILQEKAILEGFTAYISVGEV